MRLQIMLKEVKNMLKSLKTFWMMLTKTSFSDLTEVAFCLLMIVIKEKQETNIYGL